MQKPRELAELLRLLDHPPAMRVLEIGGMYGGTVWAWRQIAASLIVVVDKFVLEGRMERATDVPFILIEGDSHSPETRARVEPHAPFDFLFIDGDHSYEGVRNDFLMYAPWVNEGGIIALHDVSVEQPARVQPQHDVAPWWNQVREYYDHREIYDATGDRWGGIGVLFVSSGHAELVASLVHLPMPTAEQRVATVPYDEPCQRCGKQLVWGEDTVCRACTAS